MSLAGRRQPSGDATWRIVWLLSADCQDGGPQQLRSMGLLRPGLVAGAAGLPAPRASSLLARESAGCAALVPRETGSGNALRVWDRVGGGEGGQRWKGREGGWRGRAVGGPVSSARLRVDLTSCCVSSGAVAPSLALQSFSASSF